MEVRIAKSIPAKEWLSAKTKEDKEALREKYTVILSGEEAKSFDENRKKAAEKPEATEEAPSPFEAELAALRKEIEELKADRK